MSLCFPGLYSKGYIPSLAVLSSGHEPRLLKDPNLSTGRCLGIQAIDKNGESLKSGAGFYGSRVGFQHGAAFFFGNSPQPFDFGTCCTRGLNKRED
jgi:hypothetical protein